MRKPRVLWGCALAAALLLTSCGKNNAGSSGSGSMSGVASGSSSASQTTAAWKTGLGVITEASEEDRTGSIELVAAAVLLDGDGKISGVKLDELETTFSAGGDGAVNLPKDYRTKRQKGDGRGPAVRVHHRSGPLPGCHLESVQQRQGAGRGQGRPGLAGH